MTYHLARARLKLAQAFGSLELGQLTTVVFELALADQALADARANGETATERGKETHGELSRIANALTIELVARRGITPPEPSPPEGDR